MKKSDLVKKITSQTGVTADKAGKIVNVVFDSIAEELKNGGSFNQDKFGTFKAVERAARKGRNPKTNEEIDIPARKTVKLVVSNALKTEINA